MSEFKINSFMPPELLEKIGQLCYGSKFVTQFEADLDIKKTTLGKMLNGKSKIYPSFAERLQGILDKQTGNIEKAKALLNNFIEEIKIMKYTDYAHKYLQENDGEQMMLFAESPSGIPSTLEEIVLWDKEEVINRQVEEHIDNMLRENPELDDFWLVDNAYANADAEQLRLYQDEFHKILKDYIENFVLDKFFYVEQNENGEWVEA